MRKTIFIHLLNDYSGSPKVLSQCISVAKENGLKTELYTSKGEGFLSGVTENSHTFFYKYSNHKILTLIYFIFSQLILFFKLLKYWRHDAQFYVNTMLPVGAGLAGKLMRKRVIYHLHETSIKPKIFKKALKRIIELTASEVVYVSEHLKQSEPFNDQEGVVVYNSVSTAGVTRSEGNDSCLNRKDFRVLMACSLKAYKGVFEFTKIADLLSNTNNIYFDLILNASRDEVRKFFKDTQIPENMTIHPKQNDMTKFYQKSSLLVNLSRIDQWVETFGLTLLEAMSYGIPVIAPPVGGPAELIEEGVQGFLISSYEPQKIADKVLWLSGNPEAYKEMSKAARCRFNDFSQENFEKQILKVMNG